MTSRGLCLLALTASFLGSIACSSDSGTTEKAGELLVFSWWVEGGEADAFNAVKTIHETKYPKVTVTNASIALGTAARPELRRRMENNEPPDLFQANIGADLLQWAGAQPKVEDLTDLAASEGWSTGSTAFYSEILAENNLSQSNKLYAVPVNIHRINPLFVNLEILARNNITVDSLSTLEGLNTALDTLDADAALLGGINIGASGQWTLATMILESIVPAVGGGQFYEDYFRGTFTSGDQPQITEALAEAATLWSHVPTTTSARAPTLIDWVPALDDFVAGNVAMTVMGDWAKGLLDIKGMQPGVQYQELPFPSKAGVAQPFIYTADTFALPVGAASHDLAVDFLKTVASDEGQLAFNKAKGSIPPRQLADESTFDDVTRNTIGTYRATDADRRIALSGITSALDVNQVLFDFAASCEAGACNPAPVVTALVDNYSVLQP